MYFVLFIHFYSALLLPPPSLSLSLSPSLSLLSLSLSLSLSGDPEDACPDLTWRCDLLKKIDLSHNRLRTLPDTFKTLRRLNTFTASYNHLHSLPPSMGLGCINLVSTCTFIQVLHVHMYF